MKDSVKLFQCDFSTSTITDTLATKITTMDIFKNYFEYVTTTKCGFPQITLGGNKNDWIKLKEKTEQLLQTRLDKRFSKKWGEALLPLLDASIDAFDGIIDSLFWNSMIKRGGIKASGSCDYYNGCINILFPFTHHDVESESHYESNKHCVPYAVSQEHVIML